MKIFATFLLVSLLQNYAQASCKQSSIDRRQELLEVLEQREVADVVTESTYKQWPFGEVKKVELGFTSIFDGSYRSVEAKLYRPRSRNQNTPIVFINSPIVGTTPLDTWIAYHLARRGVSSVVSHYRKHAKGFPQIENTYQDILDNIQAQMSVVDWGLNQDFVDRRKTGLIGMSFGAVRSSFLAGVEPRIKAVTLAYTGMSFFDLIQYSQNPLASQIRAEQMKAIGTQNIAEYRNRFEQEQNIFIKDLLCDIDSRKFLLYIDENDVSVPTVTQERLATILEGSTIRRSNLGHVPAVLRYGTSQVWQTLDFFEDIWKNKQ